MRPEDFELQKQDEDLRTSRLQNQNLMQQGMAMQDQNPGMLIAQLDLSEELERIENLLHGRKLVKDENGEPRWEEPESKDAVVLSKEGIQFCLNCLGFYLNKNTLLSNFDEETIFNKMEDFSISLSDALFMSYEKYFNFPSEEELQEFLKEKIDNKAQRIVDNCEIEGRKVDVNEVKEGIIAEMNIEVERTKLREGKMKERLKGFDMVMRMLQDSVHSTYMRAWKGQERLTLRQHHSIVESRPTVYPQQQQGSMNPFSWFKKNR